MFGFAWGNLLGSLSALAKQERMLVINDISGALAVSHAVTPTYHRAHNRDNGISVKRAFMQHTTTARVIFPAIRTDCSFTMKIRHFRVTPPSEGFVLLAVYFHQNVVKKNYILFFFKWNNREGVSLFRVIPGMQSVNNKV